MPLTCWLNLSKTRFLGGPNGPKICGGRTKTDFKDWGKVPDQVPGLLSANIA